MKTVFIILAALAFVHIARPETANAVDQSVVIAPAKSDVCSANGQTYQPGDRYCVDKTAHRVCNWGGEWVDDKCPDQFECMPLPNDNKKIQCFQFIHFPYPTGPNGEVHQPELHSKAGGARRRRSDDPHPEHSEPQAPGQKPDDNVQAAPAPAKSDACSANGQTYQPGDRYCVDKTTHRVCNWGGVWIDDKCPDQFECMHLPNDNKKVQCFQFIHYPYPTGPNGEVHQPDLKPKTGGALQRRRRNDDPHAEHAKPQSTDVKPEEGAQAAPAPAKSDACSANGQTYQPGDRYCVDKTTHRVCNWGGVWIDDKCPDQFECMHLPNDNKKVQCFQFIHYPYPTGPNGEVHQPELKPKTGGRLLRLRRAAAN